jgi:PAS domain S-box-containing protein
LDDRLYRENFNAIFIDLIDNLPLAVIITSLDLSIVYVNPAFSRLTGFSVSDVRGKQSPYPWWPLVKHQEYLAELSLVKEGKKHKSDWLFNAKDGHEFWIKASVAPMVIDGHAQYLIACWTDISINKRAELELQQKLDDLNGRF